MMHLPPLQTLSNADICVSGDVTIHPSAVVAPGAILQAAPNSRIIIGEGACIGMGAVLNACQGIIEVCAGAVLGAGVLIVGWGEIGKNACIGTATTIFNASVGQMAVVPAGSLIGDTSSQAEVAVEPEPIAVEESEEQPEVDLEGEAAQAESHPQAEKTPVVGQMYVNNLLYALFPDRR
jgi:carbon dioxide concentrating mechanism protein CcmN